MRLKFGLIIMVMMLMPHVIILVMVHNTILAADRFFNQIVAVSLVAALFIALVSPGLMVAWLIGKPLEKIRGFCALIKSGEYQTRLLLSNQPREEDGEDFVALLMRDMNWMARQIEMRERELNRVISELRESRRQVEENNKSLASINAALVSAQDRLSERTTELEDALQQMRIMAMTDPLTAIANRRCFFDTLERQAVLPGCVCRPLSLAVIDVDRFKTVNDTYGHDAGDKVLQEIAGLIKQNCRGRDLAARIGGEEFTLLLPETGAQDAVSVARRIKTAISSHIFQLLDGRQIAVTVSIGICTSAVAPFFDKDKLFNYADQALYYSKTSGRNGISVFDTDISKAVRVS